MILLKLFYEFFKIGLFAIGGGAATIPFLSSLSDATGWFTKTDLANMIAISESTPGAIGVNMSSYVGFEVYGIAGCVTATLGLVAPSVIIIIIVAGFLKRFRENSTVKSVFYGLRPASTGLIAAAAFEIVKLSLINIDAFCASGILMELFNIKNIILFIILFAAMRKWKLHPVFYIGAAAIVGIIFKL
ncbi:MAG: chromate transporter [Clostridia bacterium]|nr:chromate transporter [Clostridia bacterium]